MNLMSIDPSKKSLGLYISLSSKNNFSLSVKAIKDEPEKITYLRISETIKFLIEHHSIDIIFIEDYALSKFGKSRSVSTLAEITGIIKNIVAENSKCKGLIKVPISTWKSIFRGLPKYKNKKYVEAVNNLYGKKFKTADEVDAYLIMVAMYFIWRGFLKSETQVKLQKEMMLYGEVWPKKILQPENKII